MNIKLNQTRERYEANAAFDVAIATGRLSADAASPCFAGHYMYMGRNAEHRDMFKHINTRAYLD